MEKHNRYPDAPDVPDSRAERAYPFEFSTTVAAGDTAEVAREIPFDGHITTVIIGWPDGTGNGVGVNFGFETGDNLVPRNHEDEYIAANDFTYPFRVRSSVDEGDSLVANFVNEDTQNDHFINLFVEVTED